MNIQQLQIVIAVAEYGSISKAAEKFFISQPNASSNIKALEAELGFSLFWRTRQGVRLTEEGQKFVDHARIIVHHANLAKDCSKNKLSHRLHVCAPSFSPAKTAFERFVSEHITDDQADVSFENRTWEIALRGLYQLQLDIYVCLCPPKKHDVIQKSLDIYHLTQKKIAELPICLNVRRAHPLVQSGQIDRNGLSEYPFVDYAIHSTDMLIRQMKKIGAELRYRYRIVVNESSLRCGIVSSTDAFSIGVQLSKRMLDTYGLLSFPIEAEPLQLYVIFREGEGHTPEIRRYIELLQEESSGYPAIE